MADFQTEFAFEICDVIGCDKVGEKHSGCAGGLVLCDECWDAYRTAYYARQDQRREAARPIERAHAESRKALRRAYVEGDLGGGNVLKLLREVDEAHEQQSQ